MTAGGVARRAVAVRKVGALRRWLRRSWPSRWWARQSLRARLTLLSAALFTFAVATGAVLLLVLQRYALTRVLDSSAQRTAADIARQIEEHPSLRNLPTTSGASRPCRSSTRRTG
jgi:sensor histidine kinase regulating citrate/malate metabolism